jgi:hypothetical protein
MDKKVSIGLFIVFLIIVAVVSFIYASRPIVVEIREIAAVVNGQPIYIDQIDKEFATLTHEQQQTISQIELLDFLVERVLLLQEAFAEGITVSQQEVNLLYRTYVNVESFDLAETERALAEKNLSIDEFLIRLSEQVAITKLLESKGTSVVKNSEVQKIYEESFEEQGVLFEDVENEIVLFILEKQKENTRVAYLNNLKSQADIVVLVDI